MHTTPAITTMTAHAAACTWRGAPSGTRSFVWDTVAPANWAPLRGRTSLTSRWNLAVVIAGTAASVTGSQLGLPSPPTKTIVSNIITGAIAALPALAASVATRAAGTGKTRAGMSTPPTRRN